MPPFRRTLLENDRKKRINAFKNSEFSSIFVQFRPAPQIFMALWRNIPGAGFVYTGAADHWAA